MENVKTVINCYSKYNSHHNTQYKPIDVNTLNDSKLFSFQFEFVPVHLYWN